MSSGDEAIATSSATTSSVVEERERRLWRKRERGARQHCETAENREESLRKRRVRDIAGRATQTSEQR